jgi:hypothetical protein
MITAREVVYGLFGAWRLARFDPVGLQYFDRSREGFWRSFWAAVIAAPGYAILIYLRLAERLSVDAPAAMGVAQPPITAGPLRLALIEGIAYVVGWVAFPLTAWYLVSALGRAERYFGYIVAYNWASLVPVGAYLLMGLIGALGVLPDLIEMVLSLAVTGYILVYLHYIARTALGIEALPAAGLVFIDVLIAILLSSVVEGLETR